MAFTKCFFTMLLVCISCHSARADDDAQKLKDAGQQLEQAFASSDADGMTAAVRKIASIGTVESVKMLCQLDVIPPRQAYLVVAKALAAVDDEAQLDVMVKEYKKAERSKLWTRQIMLIDALADEVDGPAGEVFKSSVTDKHPKVRLATIRALASTEEPTKLHVELLIESLKISEKLHDVGIPHVEARQALALFTQQYYKPHKEWVKWFKSLGDDFEPVIVKQDIDVEEIDEENLKYYEVPVTSRRMLFIIDTSGSMSEKMTFTGTSESGGELEETTTRMKRAKKELSQLLGKLPPYTAFNIIQFNSNSKSWKRTMTPWSQRNIKSAQTFTTALDPGGQTSANEALTQALQNNLNADTIYFLSDGAPTDGSPDEILQNVELLNRFMRVQIHTISFGPGGQALLKPLADQNNGQFQLIDAK